MEAARNTRMILFRAAAWATLGCAWQGAQSKSSTTWASGSSGASRCRKSFSIQIMRSALLHALRRRKKRPQFDLRRTRPRSAVPQSS